MVTQVQLLAEDGVAVDVVGTVTVGRSPERDLTIESTGVSRNHATLAVTYEGLTVTDNGSANGTTVNGVAIQETTALRHGDQICFDTYSFRVIFDSQPLPSGEPVPETVPEDATQIRIPEPAPQAPVTPDLSQVPGAWTDTGTSEGTQFMSGSSDVSPQDIPRTRRSDIAHLVVFSQRLTSGDDVIELELGDGAAPDTWEIGRHEDCEICLDEPSLSNRHAQLVHESGQWRVVNLVSTNGIFINGERRLSAYLGAGDLLELGDVRMVFHPQPGAAEKKASPAAPKSEGNKTVLLASVIVVGVILAAAAWWFLR